ncbi:MAG: twin-arginine translocase subunit TatC [Legionellales bacterium]|nr:twin-arginine translocase subunit TatC [Legionellales bacterium]|tara:strand:+ start:40900 stop:41619 length:720 start_codon:yes stop_codon:yes gene_type:complete
MTETTAMALTDHLTLLRRALLRAAGVVLLLFIVFCVFSEKLYGLLALPLLHNLMPSSQMIATHIAAPLITPLKLAFYSALFVGMPYCLWELWHFVAPGMYHHEKKPLGRWVCSSIVLFYAGIAFAYFIVFPLVFGFFVKMTPAAVTFMPDMSQYLSFTLQLFFAFGLAFQVPVVTVFMIASGITSKESLRRKRPFIIIGAFTLGMLLTPPDVVSQLLLAIPLWLLFEVGLLLASNKPNG